VADCGRHRGLATACVVGFAILAAGCSWSSPRPSDTPESRTTWSRWGDDVGGSAPDGSQRPAAQAVDLATGLIGVPYRWGGATPDGFDCSGLVYYTFRRAGVPVPRTSQEQYRAARPVPIESAAPGDLVFFGRRGRISHVGIYLGDERFIHAPEAGRTVTIAHLADGHYRARFAGAGRID
jgi:cell wall-associated NlpC family hydrolase